jgi:hypothetical protein
MTDTKTFGDVAEVEMHRRGMSQATEVCAINARVDWIQGFVNLLQPDEVSILDFPHAAEHLNLLLEALQ